MAERIKQLWRCAFSYKNKAHVLYRHAYTAKQAWLSCCRYLAKIDGVPLGYVTGLFSDDNYLIELETEMKEV